MPQRIKDRLFKQERQNFVGRTGEIATLLKALADKGLLVTFGTACAASACISK